MCHEASEVLDVAGVLKGESGAGHCWCVTMQVRCWTLLVCWRVSQVLDVAGVSRGK